ncbi:MAG: T9SS type A sorting domain-containing protein [Burkholderiales bacterium]|nr:T9SS type A sorting domain-containing protein [Bacteroidia bacterium]
MKNIITLYTILFAFIGWWPAIGGIAKAQNVNIPDANFKATLVSNPSINTNSDTEIQVSEAAAFSGTINVNGKNISDLTGIESFISLSYLSCCFNSLHALNVSANIALKDLKCSNNYGINSLDVSFNTALVSLDCAYTGLINLNITSNTDLAVLLCGNNILTSLDVSSNTALVILDCAYNQLTNLNLSGAIALEALVCYENNLTSLDVSANSALTNLNCGFNQLTNLDVSANTALKSLHCYKNQLSTLNLATNTVLNYLNCCKNQLTALNVSANTALITLYCYENQLTGLDVSANTTLEFLWCMYNQLTSLNVKNGNNANLTYINTINNPHLTCIQVDSAAYMSAHWPNQKDLTASYSANCTVTGLIEMSNGDEMTIYPNPGNGVFTLTTNQAYDSKLKIEIIDVTGQLVKSINEPKFDASANLKEINISELSNGIYFLKAYNGSFSQTLKVLKE